jgi:ketosteroid isomerase-like protein
MHSYIRFALLVAALGCAAPAQQGGGDGGNGGSGTARVQSTQPLHDEIAAMLERSAQAWNRGDLDAFVSDYLDSSRTTYVGRRGIVRGRAAIRDVYAPRFAPGGVRDSLSFEGLEVDSLAPGVTHVLAYYVLSRGDSTVARGPTSLVMLRVGERWKIVHDHSS